MMNTNSETPKLLSVVVPVRKMAGKLEFLTSWLQETATKSIQVIIVHDYYDDETANELKQLISRTNLGNIDFLEGYFGNPGSARNAGFALANTVWISFWDSDDLPDVEEFLAMVQLANAQEAECAVGSFSVFRGLIEGQHKKYVIDSKSQTYLDEIAMNPGIWRWAFRKSILGESKFLPIRMGEDVSFLSDLNVADRKIFSSSRIVYKYQTGFEGQLTSQSELISDLVISVEFLLTKLQKSSTRMKRFVSILFCRQVLTVIRKGTYQSKIDLLIFLVRNTPILLRYAPPISMAMRFVLQNREPLGN
jgi:glycosyltransferase involved in cell wall biosynthesis